MNIHIIDDLKKRTESEKMMFRFLLQSASYCISEGCLKDLGITKETKLDDVNHLIIKKVTEFLDKFIETNETDPKHHRPYYPIIAMMCFEMYKSGMALFERVYVK